MERKKKVSHGLRCPRGCTELALHGELYFTIKSEKRNGTEHRRPPSRGHQDSGTLYKKLKSTSDERYTLDERF